MLRDIELGGHYSFTECSIDFIQALRMQMTSGIEKTTDNLAEGCMAW